MTLIGEANERYFKFPTYHLGGMGWMVSRYPQYFNSNNSAILEPVEGLVSFADYRGEDLDDYSPQLDQMGFSLNWDASFPFQYQGVWLPEEDNFVTCFPHDTPENFSSCVNVSIDEVNQWYNKLRGYGDYHVCTYGNIFEFGWQIKELNENLSCDGNSSFSEQLSCDSNFLLRSKFLSNILKSETNELVYGGIGGSIVMDPTGAYKDHLVEISQRVIQKTPAEGLCIDGQDWVGRWNSNADDGFSLFNNQVSGLTLLSWKNTIETLADLWHLAGKFVFINDHAYRLDMMQFVDGIIDEFGDQGYKMTSSALLGLNKPVYLWDHAGPGVGITWDSFLQQHLYVGAFPFAPFPNNDHSIQPNSSYGTYFLHYGLLFRQLRNRQWALNTTFSVAENLAKANLFQNLNGYVMPIVFGPAGNNVTVQLDLPFGDPSFSALYPGNQPAISLNYEISNGIFLVAVPLKKEGCALLLMQPMKY